MATLDQIASTLRRAQDDRGAVVLIGAGCSKTAGIPLAGELMNEIARDFGPLPPHVESYADHMRYLAPGERRKMLARYVDIAQINWAHLALAQLVARGYVQCVLTTNFDPLIVRSCALLGSYPAVYDVPSSKFFEPAEVVYPSIFYLHGQRTGFIMLNTDEEFRQNALGDVFRRIGERRPWIVIGYSGNSDPVFEQLASYERFDFRLYWIGYQDALPTKHVQERLLIDGKFAEYVNGYDADSFFVELAKKLDAFPPDVFKQPFTHLRKVVAAVKPFDIRGHGKDLRELVVKQIERVESQEAPAQRAIVANALVTAGNYDELLRMFRDETDASPEIAEAVAWGWVQKGLALMDDGEAKGDDAKLLEAIRCDEEALKVHPLSEAHFNWGYALGVRSALKEGDEAKQLFDAAREQYALARKLAPDDPDIPFNLGDLLSDRAGVVDEGADDLLRQAINQYTASLKLKKDDADALMNRAAALVALARVTNDSSLLKRAETDLHQASDFSTDPAIRQALAEFFLEQNDWDRAVRYYSEAIRFAPLDHELLYARARVAHDRALAKRTLESFVEADRFFDEARHAKATFEIYNSWGLFLMDWGENFVAVQGSSYGRAEAMFVAALSIERREEAYNNLGVVRRALAKFNGNASLEAQAESAFKEAEKLVIGSGSYNLACLYAARGDGDAARKWLLAAREHDQLPPLDEVRNDPDLAPLRDADWFKDLTR